MDSCLNEMENSLNGDGKNPCKIRRVVVWRVSYLV